ncbi:hypothetical protein MKZ38_006033 [Zalerion maritima]|uniref:Exocyst complex component SEC15 n=1 Tax=Zalerion maritima TaxID=339359 RepID=A0AAD5RJZ7_9PEZI|nr:hypothetical protein MKZ38_006033 [Zalerion maritima]
MVRRAQNFDDYGSAVHEVILASSDTEFFDQLIPVLNNACTTSRAPQLMQSLTNYSDDREADIERIGLTKHEEFLSSVTQLQSIRQGTVKLTTEILELNESIQTSTEKLAQQKQALVNTRAVRQNISEASSALHESLKILHAVNNAHELIRKKKYYAALKALDDLQNEYLVPILQNKFSTQHQLAAMIQRSIPTSKKMISEAVMADLKTWLYRVRETSQFLGEVAFYNTELRRVRQKNRVEEDPFLSKFKLNSAVELVFDESEEFDVLDNDELQVDFTPLFECLHIHEALNQSEKFRNDYSDDRRSQRDLLIPRTVNLDLDAEQSLSSLLEGIAGFAIIEKATMRRVPNLRTTIDVDTLWESMCSSAIELTERALEEIVNAEELLKIKTIIALFIQTMERWGYSVERLDNFLLTLFEKYADLLKRRFSEDFQEIVQTDDYMPMTIENAGEYEKVMNVSWFVQDQPLEELTFPCVLPFSQMYPLSCIDIRNFLNQFYFFADDHFQHPTVIDETLRKASPEPLESPTYQTGKTNINLPAQALDELLTEKVCNSLVERLSSQYLGQIVQILINLEHFEIACRELEQLLIAARSSTSAGGPITLEATERFRDNKKTAEKRIFELVNSKIDDLIDTAEYEWTASNPPQEPSNYMQTLTRYLSNIMNSVLLGLPREIKELIYFDALSHASEKIIGIAISPDVRAINPHGVAALAKDVQFLVEFVDSLENAVILRENLDELQQTITLLQSENTEELYDISIRNRKYGRVDALRGPQLLEKLVPLSSGVFSQTRNALNFRGFGGMGR